MAFRRWYATNYPAVADVALILGSEDQFTFRVLVPGYFCERPKRGLVYSNYQLTKSPAPAFIPASLVRYGYQQPLYGIAAGCNSSAPPVL
jgi:hypothetical protein